MSLNQRKNQVSDELIDILANKTENFNGADLENIVNESAYGAVKSKSKVITDINLQEAMAKIIHQKNTSKKR